MPDPLELTDFCICVERQQAIERAEFFCLVEKGGWVFTDGPFRCRSVNGVLKETEDHTGEPFVYQSCPFCGAVLPIYNADWQSDGEG